MRLARILAACCVALLVCAPATQAQKKKRTDPANCTWCKNDPQLLAAAGLVSHGPFPFGKKGSDSAKVDELLSTVDILWIESANYRVGFAAGPMKVRREEKKKVMEELARLKQALPAVAVEEAALDEWQRLHLYAQRLEDIFQFTTPVLQDELRAEVAAEVEVKNTRHILATSSNCYRHLLRSLSQR